MLSVGSTAIAGGAVLGSGAFSQVEADRDVTVNIADDSDAYLQLAAENEAYAAEVEDILELEFGDDEEDGTGVNDEALSSFNDVFSITNQGSNDATVNVEYDNDAITLYTGSVNEDGTVDELENEELLVEDEAPEDDATVNVGVQIDTNVDEFDGDATVIITATA